MRWNWWIPGIVASLLLAQEARADTIYVSDNGGGLHAYDTGTGASTLIGTTSAGAMLDIAIDRSGQLYGLNSGGGLYRISTTDASVSLVGSNSRSLNALAFDASGALYGSSEFGGLYTLDVATGSASLVNAIKEGAVEYRSSGDLVFDAGGTLFLSTTTNDLVRVDPTNGNATRVGRHGKSLLYGLAYDRSGVLYGFQRNSLIWTIDPTTAAATFEAVGPFGFGAAGNPFPSSGGPVPEPGTLVLFGSALAAGMGARRHRRSRVTTSS